MLFCIKKAISIFLIIGVLLLHFPDMVAAATPSINVPASIQAEAGQSFSVPITLQAGSVPMFVNWLDAFPEAGHVTVESRNVNKTLSASSSVQLSLIGSALTPGITRVRIEVSAQPQATGSDRITLTGEVLVEVNDSVGHVPRPRFSVSGASFVPADPDLSQPFTINVALRNIGDSAAHNLTAALDGGKNFAVTALTNTVHLNSVERGATTTASFQVRALHARAANQATLTLSYGAHTQTETLNLPLPTVRAGLEEPVLEVTSFALQPERDGRFTMSLTVHNGGETEAANIKVSLDGGDRLFPAAGGNIRNISSLAPRGTSVVEYQLYARGNLAAHPVNISFDYFSPAGTALKNSDRIFISANREPDLKLTGFSASPDGDGGSFLLNLQLKNKGYSTARDIALRFTGNQTFMLDGSDLVLVPELAAGSTKQLSLRMMTGAQSNIYSIPVEITYRSAANAEHKTNETIVLAAAAVGGPKQQGTPRVMLEKHTLSTDQVLAGGNFTLTLYIKNNAVRPVGNIKISLGTVQVGTGTGGAATTGGTVFSPLGGSSDSFFVDSITARGRLVKEVNLFVDPNAAAMTYALPITIEFEDSEGKAFSVSETVNIPVLQESRLQVLALEVPALAIAGQPVPISMEFANTGRVALSNVLVSIEGNFQKENATYFVPRMDIGISDFFQGMIIPVTEGTLSGNLAVTFLDGRNRQVRIDHPFTMEVQPLQELELGMPIPEPESGQSGGSFLGTVYTWGGAAVLIIGIAAVIAVKKSKSRRREQFLDEQG